MRNKLSKILVTGGAGFIGSEFIRQGVKAGYEVVLVDKLTYAGDLFRLKEVEGKYKFYKVDISNRIKIEQIFKKEKPRVIVNFAAETHVDRSILDADSFIETNIKGVQVLLDSSRKYRVKKFIHISTDEVYGDIKKGKFTESSPISPSSPYSATKAAADCLISSYIRTYKFPATIVRPSNNYGPWQYPEKLVPVIIHKAKNNLKVPVYAKGLNKREWLYVSDCAKAVFLVLRKGKLGEVYNVGSSMEKTNIEVVKTMLKILQKPKDLIQFIKDRPGHDFRYALNFSKILRLGWKPKVDFDQGIQRTIKWYSSNDSWVKSKAKNLEKYWEKVYRS